MRLLENFKKPIWLFVIGFLLELAAFMTYFKKENLVK